MEDVILHGSNPVQNFRPTEPGEPQFVSESPVDTLWQRSPLVEQDLRSSAQICEEGLKSHRGATDRQVRLIHAVRGHILLREVNTVPPGVDGPHPARSLRIAVPYRFCRRASLGLRLCN